MEEKQLKTNRVRSHSWYSPTTHLFCIYTTHFSQEPLLEPLLVVITKEVTALICKESPQQPKTDVQIRELAILLSSN